MELRKPCFLQTSETAAHVEFGSFPVKPQGLTAHFTKLNTSASFYLCPSFPSSHANTLIREDCNVATSFPDGTVASLALLLATYFIKMQWCNLVCFVKLAWSQPRVSWRADRGRGHVSVASRAAAFSGGL